jgi:putative oxidoreductase
MALVKRAMRSTMALYQRHLASTAPKATLLVRILVGWVFVAEGVQKFLFPDSLGVGRFAKIGIPDPAFTAPFVGTVEIACGLLILIGFLTRLAAIPLLIDISVAIATTKIPMLVDKGFWPAAHEARTDLSMLFGLLFLLIEGAGSVSLDSRLSRRLESSRGTSNPSESSA